MALRDLESQRALDTRQEDVERLRLLVEASGELLASVDVDMLLPRVVELAQQILAADAHAVWRYREDEDEWTIQIVDGLSEEYQRRSAAAIRGNETNVLLTGPVIAEDIALADWLTAEHREAHLHEGNRAFVAVPLRHGDRLIGTLAFYYRRPRAFAGPDLRAATALANLAAAALGTADLYQRQRAAAEQRRFLADASALLASSLEERETLAGIARLAVPTLADWCIVDVLDPDTSVLREVAVACVEPRKEAVLREMRRLYAPSVDSPQPAARALRSGETVAFPEFTPESLRGTVRDERHLELIRELDPRSALAVPLVARGHTLGAITFALSESGRRYGPAEMALAEELARHAALAVDNARLYRGEREARERLSVLADASTLLASSLDYETTLSNVAGLIVPDYADWCAVDLVDEQSGDIRRIAVVHRDPAKAEWGERSKLLYAPARDEKEGSSRAVRTGEALLYREISDDFLAATAASPGQLEVLRNLGMNSAMVVPLVTRGRRIGALMLVSAGERRYTEDDLDFAQHLARRAAAGVDNARLYRASEESRALLDTLFSTAPIGLAFVDRELRYVRVNDALAEINGLPPDEHLGRRPAELLGELGLGVAESLRRVVETDVPIVDQEVAGETPAAPGIGRDWLTSYYPVRSADGEIVGVGIVVSEITERKHAEDARRFLSEASTVLASSLDYRSTLAWTAELAVPAFADWCVIDLLDRQERLRRVATAHVDPEKVDLSLQVERRWPPSPDDPAGPARVAATGEPELRGEIADELLAAVAKDEEHLRLLREIGFRSYISVPLTARGRVLGALTFVRAGVARRYAEQDLAVCEELGRRAAVAVDNALLYREVERRAQAAQALAFVGDGVLLVDRSGIVRLWNPAAEAITGLEEADVVGRRAADAIPGWATLAPSIPEGPRPDTLPIDVHGRELWLSISGVAFEGGTVYAFRDLTEERTVEKLKSDFVATVSHELRTPLAAIYGAALTLRREDFEVAEAQKESLLDVIAAEADRLARTVNDVLWASRLESKTMQVAIESCDGGALLRDVADAASTYLPEALEIRVEDPGDVPPVAADSDKVRSVLTNLVDNAIKYSPDGGQIRLGLERGSHRVRFVVRDEGLGIPPAERERVFEKFYRLDPNLTRGVGGTGLGLYICRELVRRMEGAIWAEANGANGSTFVVELPQAPHPSAA